MSDEKILDQTHETPEETPMETVDSPKQEQETQASESMNEVPAQPRKKKTPIIIAIAGLAVVVIAAVLLVGNLLNGGSSSKAGPAAISAKMTDDGTAYIPLMDGSCVTINEDVKSATITKDKKHIVVLLKDGTLYVTDKEQSQKDEIASNCDSISDIRNEGFFYTDKKKEVYRVAFEDFSPLKLGKEVEFTVARNSISVIYATVEGNIYTMNSTETEGNKVGTYSGSVTTEAISDDGKISVWVTTRNDVQTIVLNDGDEKVTLGEVNYKYNYTYAVFSEDQEFVVIGNLYSDRMWMKYPEKEPIEVKLGAIPGSGNIFTDKCHVSKAKAGEISSLYVSTEANTGSNVYHISMEGDRERILSKISNYYVANGNIVYKDSNNTLYFAKLDNDDISDEVKIASDVDIFEFTDNGKYVYYMKDYKDESGSFYCYKIGEDDPVKIASDVAAYYGGERTSWMYTTYSSDGASVFFFKDMEEISGTYSDQGTLMQWTYGDDSAAKISSDVMNYSVTSVLDSAKVNTDSFLYMKYSSVDKDNNIYVDWMYYNGEKATAFAVDVIE